jgi:hypothetical protein
VSAPRGAHQEHPNMTITTLNKPEPYSDEVAFIEDAIDAILSRCARLGLQREINGARHSSSTVLALVGPDDAEVRGTPEQRRKFALLKTREEVAHRRMTERLDLNRARGPEIGILTLIRQHDLDQVEVDVLLLGLVPAISSELADEMHTAAGICMSAASPGTELVAAYCNLDLRAILGLKYKLGRDGKLAKAGLIEVEHDDSDPLWRWPMSGCCNITEAAFRVITGLNDDRGQAKVSP